MIRHFALTKYMGQKRKNRRHAAKQTITAALLIERGYTYKLESMTPEEADEWKNGKKYIDKNGQEQTALTEDYDYFFKVMPNGAEVRLYHVVGKFYYHGLRLSNIGQLPAIESSAQENKKWNDLLSTIKDSPVAEPVLPDTLKEGQSIITLKAGPLNGQQRVYLTQLAFFAEVIGKKVVAGKIMSETVRYKQSIEDPMVYIFERMI